MKLVFCIGTLLWGSISLSQSIIGKWKTIDDETGKQKSIVNIYQKGDRYFGRIEKIFPEPGGDPNPTCDNCEGDRKDKAIVGMEIIDGLKKSGDEYKNGTILDPANGKVYDCKLWVNDEGNLKVRGYLYFFYRTQTWLPYKD